MVIQPIAPPPVSSELTAKLSPPRCALKPAEAYPPQALEARAECLTVAEAKARDRHTALSSAIIVREAAVAEAVKTAR